PEKGCVADRTAGTGRAGGRRRHPEPDRRPGARAGDPTATLTSRRPMTDRIADPWGTVHPLARGDEWTGRVDSFLDAGLAPEDVDAWVQSACVLCSNGCGLDIAVKDGRMVGIRGRADDHVNRGRLGPKGLFGWQANSSPDRLTR